MEALQQNLRRYLSDKEHYDAFRLVHPDCQRFISARFLQSIFRPENMLQIETPLQFAWQQEAKKWPRKWFQFFRRDIIIHINDPLETHEMIKTSIGQANFLCWLISDKARLYHIVNLATNQQDATNKVKKKELLQPKLIKKTMIKQKTTRKKQKNRNKKITLHIEPKEERDEEAPPQSREVRPKSRSFKIEKITDPLDEDIKPKLSSKNRSRQSPTYCTSNSAWMELKKKYPALKIKIMY